MGEDGEAEIRTCQVGGAVDARGKLKGLHLVEGGAASHLGGGGIHVLWCINPGQERTIQARGGQRMLACSSQDMVERSQGRH